MLLSRRCRPGVMVPWLLVRVRPSRTSPQAVPWCERTPALHVGTEFAIYRRLGRPPSSGFAPRPEPYASDLPRPLWHRSGASQTAAPRLTRAVPQSHGRARQTEPGAVSDAGARGGRNGGSERRLPTPHTTTAGARPPVAHRLGSPQKRYPAAAAALALILFAAGGGAWLLARLRRIDADGALLRHDADLLRQLDPAHRTCLYDDRGGYLGPPPAAARQRNVLPDRDRRARRQGRPGRRGARA